MASFISLFQNICFHFFQLMKIMNPPRTAGRVFLNLLGHHDAEAETPILWPLDAKNWLIGKDHDAGKDWRWEKKGMTEDEVVGWHHWLHGHEFEQALGDRIGQWSLACCSPCDCKESDTTDWTELNFYYLIRERTNDKLLSFIILKLCN